MRREEREALKDLVEERLEKKREAALNEIKERKEKEYWEREAKKKKEIVCSFCGENADDVKCLIAGPNKLGICNNCVQLCNEIIEERFEEKKYVCPYCKEKTDKEIFEPDPLDW